MSIFRHDLKDLRADCPDGILCSGVCQEFRAGRPKVVTQPTVTKVANLAKLAKPTAFTKFSIASKIESSPSFVFINAWDSDFTSLMSPKRRESKHRSLNARYWRTDSLD